MIEDIGSYYLYRHIRLDTNIPFYIGIGTKRKDSVNDYSYERAFTHKGRNSFWSKIVNKVGYRVEILLESNDYEFIEQKEIEFIKLYGRRNLNLGELCNLTDGGKSNKNYIASKETREKISKSSKGRPSANKGKVWGEEFKRKISEALKGKKLNPKSILKRTQTLKQNAIDRGFYQSESWKNNIGKSNSKIVYQYDINNNLINQFTSCHDAGIKLDIQYQMISYACKRFPKAYKNNFFSYKLL